MRVLGTRSRQFESDRSDHTKNIMKNIKINIIISFDYFHGPTFYKWKHKNSDYKEYNWLFGIVHFQVTLNKEVVY